jgi:hypothetical protein
MEEDRMDALSKDELVALTGEQNGWRVSLYMPTHRHIPETEQDPIRFKNLLREAEERLIAGGLRAPEARELLQPAQKLEGDASFWRFQSDGLALFLSANLFRAYRLPIRFKEMVVVTTRFHLKPLLQTMAGDGRFFVLALSQKQVRLLEGTAYSVSEIKLDHVPESLAEILGVYDFEKQLQFHSPSTVGFGKQGTIFHGHGAGADDAKDKLLQYFRQIDEGLRELLKDEKAPLVFAGVDYLFPIYKEANSYPRLLEEMIAGNPESLKAEALRQEAWAIAQPVILKGQREAEAKYRQLAGTGRASNQLAEIAPAAFNGRVESLFVAVGAQRWGSFDLDRAEIHLREEPQPGDEDLLDFSALQTFLNGGAVYTVEPENVPGGGLLAAVFRY